MSLNVTQEDSVLVSLSTTTPSDITHPERRILITESQPKVYIGRSSSRTTLGLLPDMSNGWFDSPVMSRHHAELEADFQRQAINASQALKIRDAGSMHGTYLNHVKLESDVARPLVAGDEITFGMAVYRNLTIFKPATMTVEVEFRKAAHVNNPPSRVFTVPDDCSTDENLDENEPLDDDIPNGTSSLLGHQEQGNCPPAMRQVDGAIEIDSDSAPNDLISISSDDDDDDDGTHDDGEESISLTDDEQMSSVPASRIESVDLDDTVQMHDLGNRSPTWNRFSFSSYSESEQMDEGSPSIRLHSEDEHGVFLYDSDSEDKDDMEEDDDPIDDGFNPSPPMVNHSSIFTVPLLSECVAPMLPPLSTAVFSQPQYLETPFGYQLPPVGRPLARQPSPSDAVLPLSHRHHGPEDDGTTAVEDLGRKWGKTDFFEAREHNKITNSRFTEPDPSSDASLVSNAATKSSDDAATEDNCFRASSKDLVDSTGSSATETVKQKDPNLSERLSQAGESGEIAGHPVEAHKLSSMGFVSQASQAPKVAKAVRDPSFLKSGEEFSNSPLHNVNAMELLQSRRATEARDSVPESAYHLHLQKRQDQALKGQEIGPEPEAWRDLMDNSSATDSATGLPKDSTKGKRKAADISGETEQELAWHENGNPMAPPEPSSPATQSEPDSFLPTPPTSPQDQNRADARPSKKIRKIAERMGYAALGGATVGAMVFTSLIYTAPNFV